MTYQLLLLPDEASHIKAIEYTFKADRHVKQNGEIVKILRELSQEQPTNHATASAKQTARQLLQYIESDLESQEFITAANDLLEKVAHEPTFSAEMLSRIYRARGLAYRRLEDYEQAIADFNHAIALNPKRADLYRSRGKAYRELKDYKQAIVDYNYCIELDPHDVRALVQRGSTYNDLKDYPQAIKDYNRALELDPKDFWAFAYRGYVYYKLQDYQRAIENFDNALELDPKDIWAFAYRGYTYYKLQDYQRAIENFDHALKLDPKYAWAWSRRGAAYLRMKNTRQAKYNFARRWELDATRINYGWMAEWSGICDEKPDSGMTQRLEKIAASDPQNYIAYVCRGVAWWLQKNLEQSLTELERAIALKPEEWDAYFWKGMACAVLRRDEDAKTAVEKSLAVDMPPVLLAPLRWFEQDRPDFYEKYVVPLLARAV